MIVFTKKALVVLLVIFVGTASCQTPFYDEPVPALLLNGNAEDQAQIKMVIEKALTKDNVILSIDIFSKKSFLIIENSFKPSLEGNLTGGIVITPPEKFILLKDNKGCLIRQDNTDRVWRLIDIVCVRGTN